VSGASAGYYLAVATSSSTLPTDPTASTGPGCVIFEVAYSTSDTPSTVLNGGTTYYWRVRGRGPGTTYGNWSSIFSFTTQASVNHPPTLPGAPTVSAVTVTASGATVSWGASTDADGDTITYELQYTIYNTPSDRWHSAGTTTSLTLPLSGLAANTQYNVQVQASDGKGGLSGWNKIAPAFTTLSGPLSVTACDRQTLAIQILDNSAIYLPTTHLVSGVVDNANPHQNIVDTANGGQAMRSSYTDSDGTAPGGSTWLDPRLLECMIQLAGTYTYGVTEIAGGAHTSGSFHYAGRAFDVYSINGVTVNSANTYVEGFIQICNNNGARLAYLEPPDYNHIHADWNDNGGNVAPSCTVSIVSVVPNPSSVVAGNTFTINAMVNSSQSQSVLLGASLVPAGTTSGYISDPPHDASWTLNSGNNNVSRQFTVQAGTTAGTYDLVFAVWQDSNGNGQIDPGSGDTLLAPMTIPNALVVTTLPNPPSAPTATAATSVTSSSFVANWNSSIGATGYRMDVSTSSTFSSYISGGQDVELGNNLAAYFPGLSANTTYYYRVRAYNGSGTSGNSGTIAVTTLPNPPPAPTANAASSVTSSGFTANWSSASGATGYRLDISTSSTFSSFFSFYQDLDILNFLNRTVGGLSADTTYYYRVRAYNGGGASGNSGTIAVTTLPNPPLALTVSGITAANRTYNGTTVAALNTTGATLNGVLAGDTVTLVTSGAVGAFANKSVGNNKSVAISGLTLSGSAAANYTLTQPTVTASIAPAGLSVSGLVANSKVYDGTTSATIIGTPVPSGVLGSDAVSISGTASGSYASKTVANSNPVTVSGLTLSGADAGNYTLNLPTLIASIATAWLNVSGLAASSKVYDGTTSATVSGTPMLSGVFGSDSVSVNGTPSGNFDSKAVGNNIWVIVLGLTLSGTDAGNYTLSLPNVYANITPAGLSVSGLAASSKVYDSTTSATITGTPVITGVLGSDVVSISGTASGNFASKAVGNNEPVTVGGLTLSGTDAGNYTLSLPTLSANITPLGLTVTGITAANKVYDGTTTATLVTSGAALVGVLSMDTGNVTLVTSGATGEFANKNVGTGKLVTISGLTLNGSAAGNYTVIEPTTTADIVVIPVFNISSSSLVGHQFSVTVSTLPGANYTLEFKNTLGDSSWTVAESLPGTGGAITLTDGTATNPARFYRVRVQ
jgi:hypothetical protein